MLSPYHHDDVLLQYGISSKQKLLKSQIPPLGAAPLVGQFPLVTPAAKQNLGRSYPVGQ